MRRPAKAVPELIDLSAAASDLCFAKTGARRQSALAALVHDSA